MIVSVTHPVRPDADLADLTAKAISARGWEYDSAGEEAYVIRFAVNLSAEEETAIRRRLTTSNATEETLQARATSAYADLQAFEALASPTNAQVVAGMRLFSRVLRGLIRAQYRQFDATD